MGLKCGIVGLPNVGKSTLFNALTKTAAAEAANYPFCTIDPNTAIVNVPDIRLDALQKIAGSAKIEHATVEMVDIAGLVKGASKGEGLGNQFLSHIRETDAVMHVLRCFEDDNITHVNHKVDPVSDAETIETELILADLTSLEKRLPALEKKAKRDPELSQIVQLCHEMTAHMSEGRAARTAKVNATDKQIKELQLITSKPVLYVCNVDAASAASGNGLTQKVAKNVMGEMTVISADIEAEIAIMPEEERPLFLEELGLKEAGTDTLIKKVYRLLNLQTYFTAGPKEVYARTIPIGCNAAKAAGVIHSDFEKGFIKAEVISYEDYTRHNGETECRNLGKIRQEGRDYVVKDGDVMHFKFNV